MVSFPFSLKNIHYLFHSVWQLATNPPAFVYLKIYIYSCLKSIFFSDEECWMNNNLFFTFLNIILFDFGLYLSDRKSKLLFLFIFHLCNEFFLPYTCCQDFFFLLVSSRLTVIGLGVIFFAFILYGLFTISWLWKSICFIKFRKFSAINLLSFFFLFFPFVIKVTC